MKSTRNELSSWRLRFERNGSCWHLHYIYRRRTRKISGSHFTLEFPASCGVVWSAAHFFRNLWTGPKLRQTDSGRPIQKVHLLWFWCIHLAFWNSSNCSSKTIFLDLQVKSISIRHVFLSTIIRRVININHV